MRAKSTSFGKTLQDKMKVSKHMIIFTLFEADGERGHGYFVPSAESKDDTNTMDCLDMPSNCPDEEACQVPVHGLAETSRLYCVPQKQAGFFVSRRDQQAFLCPAETSRLCCNPQRPAGFAVSRRDQQALLCPAETSRLCCVPQRPAGFAVNCNYTVS
jgi:hypothetical protein